MNEIQKKNEAPVTRSEPEKRTLLRPRVDVFESANDYLVVADLPGVAKEDLDVHFEDGELRIAGTRGKAFAYERAFAMPEGIDAEAIGAELTAGVLKVRLPKAAQKRLRKIDVRAG